MRYTRDFIEKVVSATNIVEIISQHTVLKNKGKDLWGVCPFPDHKEKTASFSVSTEKQLYHCFGCKKGGNVFTFLEHYQGLHFSESLEFLADRANIPLPSKNEWNQNQIKESEDRRKSLLEITRWAAFYFQETFKRLGSNHSIQQYVLQRGLKPEILQEFKIGYAPQEWDGLVQFLKKKNLSLALAEEAGLVLPREKDPKEYYDRFRDRMMFVITNPMGEAIAFGGRVLDDSLPKYINSPETPLFHKGKSLYGLYQTGRHIRSENYALIVEGYMDLITLYQYGIKNVVAPLGTALTMDQCRLLTRFTKNVVVLFDGDDAGQMALERSLPLLFEAGCYPRGLILPDNLDPDEFIKTHGADALQLKIEKAPDLFSLLVQKWFSKYQGSAIDKMQIVHQLVPLFQSIHENALKSLYIKDISTRMGVDERWLREAIFDPKNVKPNVQIRVPPNESSIKSSDLSETKFVSGTTPSGAYANVVPTSESLSTSLQTGKNLDTSSIMDKSSLQELPIEERISLQGTPKVEILLLALALTGEQQSWVQILHTDIKEFFSHSGVKKVLKKAEDISGQSGTRSGSLVTLVTQDILHLEQLTSAMNQVPVNDSEAEAKLLNDCLRKLRMNFIDTQVKKLVQELKQTPSTEKLEQLSSLQRERMKILEKA